MLTPFNLLTSFSDFSVIDPLHIVNQFSIILDSSISDPFYPKLKSQKCLTTSYKIMIMSKNRIASLIDNNNYISAGSDECSLL